MDKQTSKQPTSPSLSFKPLSEGLGFHPFSDGLPYAPIAKGSQSSHPPKPPTPSSSNSSLGIGAVAAGVPRFVTTLPRVSVPVAPRPAPMAPRRVGEIQSSTLKQPRRLGWGYLFKRLFAYSADTLLNLLFFGLIVSRTLWKGSSRIEVFSDLNVLIVVTLVFALSHWLVMTVEEMLFGTTPGKLFFGLRLRGGAIALLLRALLFIPSASFLGVGLLWCFMDSRRCCWHDRVTGIQPLSSSRYL